MRALTFSHVSQTFKVDDVSLSDRAVGMIATDGTTQLVLLSRILFFDGSFLSSLLFSFKSTFQVP